MRIKLNNVFLEWFKQTNTHLFENGITEKERVSEIEEYVNDALHEHIEDMEENFSLEDAGDDDDDEEKKDEESD